MSKPIVRTTTNAKVTVTVELSGIGSWGPDCALSQVYSQAREEAIGRISRAFKDQIHRIKVVGPVLVEAITTDMEKRG